MTETGYHENGGRATGATLLRPYECVSTPPITLLLYAIQAHCRVGGCVTPGVRLLAEWAKVSQGCVSPGLYELARDGWITYDGRVIMLLIDPDHADDQTDHADDRFATDHDDDRSFVPSQSIDHGRDRFEGDMVLTTTESLNQDLVVVNGGVQGGGHQPPAARLMAELGANPTIVRDAYKSRPDWTPEQVRQRWEYDQCRISASDGKLREGVFFTALRCGELAPTRPDPNRPIPVERYADDPAFALGAVDPPEAETVRDHASRLLPKPTAATHTEHIRNWMFLQCRIGAGDNDEQALAALEQHRTAVRR